MGLLQVVLLLLMLCRLYGLLCGLLRRFIACWHIASIGAFYSLVAACTGFAGALQVLCVFGMASSAAALPGLVSRGILGRVSASPGGILGRVRSLSDDRRAIRGRVAAFVTFCGVFSGPVSICAGDV